MSRTDPIFWLHHTYLDKLWWEWQRGDRRRLRDMDGPNVAENMNPNDQFFPIESFTDYNGDPGSRTTLDHVLWMAGILPNVTVREVMDITDETICAWYD